MIPPVDSIRYISCANLHQLRREGGVTLIDVRVSDAFAEAHMAGAMNHCIYEVVFLDEVSKAISDKSTPIVVYGESARFKAAEVAYGRLADAGYSDVSVLSGGLQGWKEEGHPVEATAEVEAQLEVSGRYELDVDKSILRWTGRNLTNQHDGRIALKAGWIAVNESYGPIGGELVLDMHHITCDDIADPEMNKMLINHLSHDDFFKVDTYPEASFKIIESIPIPDATPGQPNFEISGDMTLRGVTKPVRFSAMLSQVTGGDLSFQAQFNVNRVDYGAVYGSGSLFERLGMHLVNDLVNIQITAIFG